ncbi:MAG: hypothetical protein KBB52_06040 [Candidatus Omnitrophica bacterium]|nr:hypothetical protein [Candidatus Omnitrophota bacterium]
MAKKTYKKPVLKTVKMIEVGAASCCRTTNGTCPQSVRSNQGKTRISSAS